MSEQRWRHPDGREVRLVSRTQYGVDVFIDGQQGEVGRVSLYRDGGTRKIPFTVGDQDHKLVLWRKIRTRHYEALDGVELQPIPPYHDPRPARHGTEDQ